MTTAVLTYDPEDFRRESDRRRREAMQYAHALLAKMTPGDRYEIARFIMVGLRFDPDVAESARAEAVEQFPHATRAELRWIAEGAAQRVKIEFDYEGERDRLRGEQIADAVANAGEEVFA